MTAFAPAITRSRELVAEKTNQVALKIVTNDSESKQADRKFFALFISVSGVVGVVFFYSSTRYLLKMHLNFLALRPKAD